MELKKSTSMMQRYVPADGRQTRDASMMHRLRRHLKIENLVGRKNSNPFIRDLLVRTPLLCRSNHQSWSTYASHYSIERHPFH
jgi:hypothetical protein